MPWGACPLTTPEGHDFPVGPELYLLETWWSCWTPHARDMALQAYCHCIKPSVCTELHQLFATSGSAQVSTSWNGQGDSPPGS